ncbi:expressed unknown protein [Seminavis robusta]|uniref:Sulfotransferase n=1 Tax=Seminavis robusta TaxID=568900 RepID=A0A9N8HS27_9STRA|nr:expressed unknown protein [Seminavis robusta]|eukprot:Sro1337_g264160.1 n/a (540) ;mRNA; r:24296-26032
MSLGLEHLYQRLPFSGDHGQMVVVVPAAIATVGASSICLAVRNADKKRHDFNESDWKVSGLPWPAFFVRCINVIPGFASFILPILKYLVIQPALRKSIATMEEADRQNLVPKILCNQTARKEIQERLDHFYEDTYKSLTLTQFAKVISYSNAFFCLENHAGLLKLAMCPEVQQEQVDKPVFIASFARTGTTILHRTMSLDRDQWRNFDFGDMFCPLPQPAARWDTANGRPKKAKMTKAIIDIALVYFYPGWMKCLETMHGIRPNEADEDLLWYSCAMGHPYMETLIRLYPEARQYPEGMSPLESKQMAKYKYTWIKMMMQLHQCIDKSTWPDSNNMPCPDHPWLLKDPNHTAYLPELLEVFPDARLIFTHRPPAEIVPSMAKTWVLVVLPEFVPGNPGSSSAEIGAEVVTRAKHYADGIVSFTQAQSTGSSLAFCAAAKSKEEMMRNTTDCEKRQRIDFWFGDVVADIPGTIEKVYAHFLGIQPSEKAKKIFVQYLEVNERAKLGNQRRSLEDFGLTKEGMDQVFQSYNEMFLNRGLYG